MYPLNRFKPTKEYLFHQSMMGWKGLSAIKVVYLLSLKGNILWLAFKAILVEFLALS